MATKFKSILCGGCLVVALATAGLWVRSHYVSDTIRWEVSAPPPPASTPASASTAASASSPVSDSNVTTSLFLLLKSQDLANPYRSVKTVPGRLVVQQHLHFEVFV